MKVKPIHLFLCLTLLVLGLGLLTNAQTLDISIHDTYIIIGYLQIAIFIGILSGLTTLCYFIMNKIGRPITDKTGYLHFAFITLGLLFILTFYKIFHVDVNIVNEPNIFRFQDNVGLLVFSVGPLLLLIGFVTFVFGFFKAITRTS